MPRTEEVNQQIREERRKQILDVAVKVFARKGLAATRIADIAAEGGMSQGLIFRYFASKEDVFAGVVERALHSTMRIAREAVEHPGTPLEKLRRLLRINLEGMWGRPEYTLVVEHALNNEGVPLEVRERLLEQARRSLDLYQQLIVEGQKAGEVVQGDPAVLTLALAACMGGLSAGMGYLPPMLGVNEPPDPDVILRMFKA